MANKTLNELIADNRKLFSLIEKEEKSLTDITRDVTTDDNLRRVVRATLLGMKKRETQVEYYVLLTVKHNTDKLTPEEATFFNDIKSLVHLNEAGDGLVFETEGEIMAAYRQSKQLKEQFNSRKDSK